MGSADTDAVTVRDERQRVGDGNIVRVLIVEVPTSEAYPEGIKYAFHYGSQEGETFLRYDNAHGTHERHMRRRGTNGLPRCGSALPSLQTGSRRDGPPHRVIHHDRHY
jgi:hypothetical protein